MTDLNEYDALLGKTPQEDGDYDSLLEAQTEQKSVELRTSFHNSKGVVPDEFAQTYNLSKETGLPTGVIERNKQKIVAQKEFEATDYDKLLNERPKTSTFLSNSDNAKLAKDDIDGLGGIEDDFMAYQRQKMHAQNMKSLGVPTTAWGKFGAAAYGGSVGDMSTNKIVASWNVGDAQTKAGAIGFDMLTRELSGGYNDASEADMMAADAKKHLDIIQDNEFYKEGVLSSILYGGVEMLPQIRDSGIAGMVGAGIGGVAGLFIGKPKAGARIGMTVASFKKALELEGGNAFLEYRDFTDENGEKINPRIAAVAALAAGSVNAGLEVVQIGRWASDIPGINKLANLKGGLSGFVAKSMKNPEVRKKLAQLSEKYSVEVLGETSIELVQEAVGIFAGEVAKGTDSGKVFEDKSVVDGVIEAAPEIMASMAGVTGATHFGGKAMQGAAKNIKKLANSVNDKKMTLDKQYLHSVAELNEYEQTIPQFRAIVDKVEKSKLLNRSKAAMNDFLSNVKEESGLETITINAQTLNEQVDTYLQKMDPSASNREIMKTNLYSEMGIADVMREAPLLGSDISISIERFIPAVAGTELKSSLEGDIRFSEDGKSYNQIVNENKYFQDRVNNEIFTQDKLNGVEGQIAGQLQDISDDIEAKLQYAGRSKAEAGAMSQIWKARALAVWDRDKIAPKEWYESKGLIVAKGTEDVSVLNAQISESELTPQNTYNYEALGVQNIAQQTKSKVFLPSVNKSLDVEYQVVELNDLIASNDIQGNINPNYPGVLQPRDRTRIASQNQVNNIANHLQPELLGPSYEASTGAPIIGMDDVVESGNGRVIALAKAYQEGKADNYKNYLSSIGYDIKGMQQPILIRRSDLTENDRAAFVKEANNQTVLNYSAVEKASIDAGKITPGLLSLISDNDINSSSNRDFVRKYLSDVVQNDAEFADMVDKNGVLTKNGKDRVEAAIFQKAYGDENLTHLMFETTDNNVKAVTKAMLDVAPRYTKIQENIEAGRLNADMDISRALVESVNLIRQSRLSGEKLYDKINQVDAFSGASSDILRAVASMMTNDNMGRVLSAAEIEKRLNRYIENALQNEEGNMFGEKSVIEIMDFISKNPKNDETLFQPVIAPNIRNKKVRVVDLTEDFKGIPAKEALTEKINALIKTAEPISTQSLEKMINFKADPYRDIVGHLVNSSIGAFLNGKKKVEHSIVLNSIEDLIKASVFVEKEKNQKPWKRNVEEYYRFYVPILLGKGKDKKIYTVRLVAEKWKSDAKLHPDVSHLYDVIIESKSQKSSNSKAAFHDSSSDLSIRVSQMLEGVKGFDDTFYTQQEKEARGLVQFSEERTLVRLLEKANNSTFLHETGHIFLKDLKDVASDERSSAQTKSDWEAVKKHYKMTDETITDAQHEQFTRDFEGYLMEGHSPSKALQSVFRRFKNWLLAIYKKADNLNLSINDDIRGVFDRLVATNQEIDSYAAGREQLFFNAKDAKMMEDEFASYVSDIERIKQENSEEAERRVMDKVKRLRSDEYRAKVDEFTAQAKEKLEKTNREYRALKLIRENEQFKISSDEARNFYNFDVDTLPAELLGSNGQDLEMTAHELGYTGASEMLLSLSRAQNIEAVANEQAVQQMAKLYPDDYLDDAKISEIVQDVLDANDKEADIAFNEYQALKSDKRAEVIERTTIENKVDSKIAFTKVRDLKVGSFKSAVDKWRYDAYTQKKEGNIKAAAFSKLKQFINQVLVTRTTKTKEQMLVQARFLERLNKPAQEMNIALPLETREAIYEALKNFNTDSKMSLREVDALKAYAKAYADGILKEVQPERLAQGQKTYYGDMTVKEFNDLYNEIQGLYTEGISANKIKIEEHEVDLQKAIDAFIKEGDKRFGRKSQDIQDYVSTQKTTTQKILKVLKDVDVSLTKMSTIAEMIDGKIGGTFHKLILENVNQSEATKTRLHEKADVFLKEAFSDFSTSDMHKMNVKQVHPAFKKPISQLNLFMFLLHAGNPDGRKRLANFFPEQIKFDRNGNQIPLSESMINAILFNAGPLSLDARHIKSAQKIWKMFDEMYPDLERVHRETGKALGKVKAAPLLTPYGVAEGGYFPIYYNNEYGSSVLYDLQEEIDQLGFAARGDYYTKTNQGRTKKREKVVLEHAVDLSMNTILRGVEDTAHDIAYRQTIMDLVKIFNHKAMEGKGKDFESAIISYTNRETYLEMIEWLKDIAAPNRNLYKADDAFVNNMYRNYSASVLTYSLKTMMVQWLSFGNIIGELGAKPFLSGVKNFVSHPVKSFETIKMIQEKSDYMRKRTENNLKNADRKILSADKSLPERLNNQVIDFGYHLIALADSGVAYPAWKMAYDKKMLEVQDEKNAIEYADMVVRNNMGSSENAHAVRMQKEKGIKKFLVAFYTEGAVHYNQAKIAIDDAVRHHQFGKLYAFFVWRFLSIGIIEQIISDALYGDDDRDDKEKWVDFGLGVFSRNLQAIPFFRNFSTRMRTMYEDPLARMMNNVGKTLDMIGNIGDDNKSVKANAVAKGLTGGVLPAISGLTGKQIVIPQKFIDYTENMVGYLNDEASPQWRDLFMRNKELRKK